ncbi:MAG: zeta toxin family protein [Flavobacteriales bacterium]|nr:zeta toxin family protein [Flavobacteriales bacterium]
MKSLKLFLEGRNDPSIFHAVFMAGAPGAGKSYVSDWMSLGPQLGYKVINSDVEFTRYMKDAGLTDDKGAVVLDPKREYERGVIRTVAKRHTKSKQAHAMIGRLGLVIDGTGANAKKVMGQKKTLEALGYETAMVYVSIPLEASIASDKKRGEDGERTIGPELVTQKYMELDKSLPKLKRSFGKLFFVIDNSVREKTPAIIRGVLNTITKWSKTMPKNKAAKTWMKNN